jgi:hypothetical protein
MLRTIAHALGDATGGGVSDREEALQWSGASVVV